MNNQQLVTGNGGLESWNFFSFHSVGNRNCKPNWRTHIFQRGGLKPPTNNKFYWNVVGLFQVKLHHVMVDFGRAKHPLRINLRKKMQ